MLRCWYMSTCIGEPAPARGTAPKREPFKTPLCRAAWSRRSGKTVIRYGLVSFHRSTRSSSACSSAPVSECHNMTIWASDGEGAHAAAAMSSSSASAAALQARKTRCAAVMQSRPYIEIAVGSAQQRQLRVFGRQRWFGDRPPDADVRVVPHDASFQARIPLGRDLIQNVGFIAQRAETVRETGGTYSMQPLAADSVAPAQRPHVGEPVRMSTATSKISPCSTDTSLPCARGCFW